MPGQINVLGRQEGQWLVMGSLLTKLVLDVGESLVLRRHELTTDLTHDGARGVQDILSVLCGHIALPLTSGLSSVQVGHSGSRMRTPEALAGPPLYGLAIPPLKGDDVCRSSLAL